ncbi:hypothetical protein EV642_12895 [Kribbella sp. VKM Ac-2500]|nr:hypothetical protein EV642_12895 [Kribbella sp. VKM Ac-2500]
MKKETSPYDLVAEISKQRLRAATAARATR